MRLIDADIKVSDYIETWQCECSENDTQTVMAVEDLQYLPTIDPIHAAGGCYCRECCFGRKPNSADMQDGYVYCQQQSKYKELDAFCSDGEPMEAQDDG